MIRAIVRELHWIGDFLTFYFWVGGFPYILQWLTVEVMRGG